MKYTYATKRDSMWEWNCPHCHRFVVGYLDNAHWCDAAHEYYGVRAPRNKRSGASRSANKRSRATEYGSRRVR